MALSLQERALYFTNRGCNPLTFEQAYGMRHYIFIGPFDRGPNPFEKIRARGFTLPDFIVIKDPIRVQEEEDCGRKYVTITYPRCYEFQIPRPLADPGIINISNGVVSADMDIPKIPTLFDISKQMRTLLPEQIFRT
jgi:hypothetical protein